MKMLLLLLLQLGVCVPLPAPLNVSISSFNMAHILSFQPGLHSPTLARYLVQTLSLSKNTSWLSLAACSELAAGQTCDLTQVFNDPYDIYRARVQAFTSSHASMWTKSYEFQPATDSVLGPPDVSVVGCGDCLQLQLRPAASLTLQQQQSLTHLYRTLQVQVRRSHDGALYVENFPYSEQTVISNLQTGVQYCVSVSVSAFFTTTSVFSRPQCVFTSPLPHTHIAVQGIGLLVALVLLHFLLCVSWRLRAG